MPFFTLLFIVVPLVELFVFLQVGDMVGILNTLLICVATAILGGFLVKQQGIATLMGARGDMARGQMPLGALFDGFCIVIAGALLLTPGFVTDMVGFALLVPAVRRHLKTFLVESGKFTLHSHMQQGTARPRNDTTIIEGEFEHVEEEKVGLDIDRKDH